MADPNGRPLWMGDLANRLLDSWAEWEAEAEQQSQVEQDSEAGKYAMLACIETAIEEEYQRGQSDG